MRNQNDLKNRFTIGSKIHGFSDQGIAFMSRKSNTDFGSPWQGLNNSTSLFMLNNMSNNSTPAFAANSIPIDQRVADFRQFDYQTPLQKRLIEAEFTKKNIQSIDRMYFLDPALTTPLASEDYAKYGLNTSKKLQVIDITKNNYSVEDADTILFKSFGGEAAVRLTGIDAPEVSHSIFSDKFSLSDRQPYGEEAKNYLRDKLKAAKSVKLVLDPQQDTYGRSLGVVIADGENLNLDLVKKGFALSLPFGDPKEDLMSRSAISNFENMAYRNKEGLWKSSYWQIYKQTMSDRARVTNVSLQRVDRLAKNLNLAGLQSTMEYAEANSINDHIKAASSILRPKMQNINEKKEYEERNKLKLNYGFSQNKIQSQLLVETKEFMNYNSSMNTKKNNLYESNMSKLRLNKSSIIDSTYQSTSSYREAPSFYVQEYNKKLKRKKRTGQAQRMANKTMNSNTQNASAW